MPAEETREEMPEEPLKEMPATEAQPEGGISAPESEPESDSTPRPRGAKGGRNRKRQESKLFEVEPEPQRPIAPFFDQTLF